VFSLATATQKSALRHEIPVNSSTLPAAVYKAGLTFTQEVAEVGDVDTKIFPISSTATQKLVVGHDIEVNLLFPSMLKGTQVLAPPVG
jgi:hypothetical protein